MTKQFLDIIKFDGGLVDDPDPMDLSEKELSVITNAAIYKNGKIVMPGTFALVVSPAWTSIITGVDDIKVGYGLFVFTADYDLNAVEASTNFLVIAYQDSSNHTQVRILEGDGTEFGSSPFALESAASAMAQVVYYLADGQLRITDANFTNSPTNRWFGFIDRTHLGTTLDPTGDVYKGWYLKNNTLAAPTRGLLFDDFSPQATAGDIRTLTDSAAFTNFTAAEINALGYIAVNFTQTESVSVNTRTNANTLATGDLTAATTWSGDTYYIYPSAGAGFNIYATASTTTGGTIPEGIYVCASSFIYDDNQESALYELPGIITVGVGENTINPSILLTRPFDPRISGGRIYIKERNTNDDWVLLQDISFTESPRTPSGGTPSDYKGGVRSSLASEYAAFSAYPWDNFIYLTQGYATKEVSVDTYQSLTGFDANESVVVDQFKTAVVVNRMAYIGNVIIDGKTYADSVFKSYPNKFDSFSKDRKLDVAINDGDNVVKLEAFADRLLEFKTKTLYIINISQEVEFLEDKKEFMGVDQPYQTCQTEYGVAWCNKYGAYLYNGERVVDLFVREGIRKINLDTWQTDYNSTNTAIAYNPIKKQLFVFSTLSSTAITIYNFDFVSFSWVKYVDRDAFGAQELTNVLPDWDGNLITYDLTSTGIHQWSDTPALDSSGFFNITFKDETFGRPSAKKNIYKVYITYTSSGATNVRARYYTNGGSTAYDFTAVSNCTVTGGSCVLDSATVRTVASMEPDTTTESHGIYSFKLALDDTGTVPAGFVIHKVTVVHRMLGTR